MVDGSTGCVMALLESLKDSTLAIREDVGGLRHELLESNKERREDTKRFYDEIGKHDAKVEHIAGEFYEFKAAMLKDQGKKEGQNIERDRTSILFRWALGLSIPIIPTLLLNWDAFKRTVRWPF